MYTWRGWGLPCRMPAGRGWEGTRWQSWGTRPLGGQSTFQTACPSLRHGSTCAVQRSSTPFTSQCHSLPFPSLSLPSPPSLPIPPFPAPSPPSYLSTSCPTYSRSRESVSPMMVERRCPTCISLAMLGEEKSITTLFFSTAGGLTPFTRMSVTSCDTKSVRRKMFTKPGPATSQRSMQRSTTSEGERLATIDSATLGGGRVWPCAFRV